MIEIIFIVEEDPEGGYNASAFGIPYLLRLIS